MIESPALLVGGGIFLAEFITLIAHHGEEICQGKAIAGEVYRVNLVAM
jgi:hypothetical protein